jgi:hypothetical protein
MLQENSQPNESVTVTTRPFFDMISLHLPEGAFHLVDHWNQ